MLKPLLWKKTRDTFSLITGSIKEFNNFPNIIRTNVNVMMIMQISLFPCLFVCFFLCFFVSFYFPNAKGL